MERHGPDALRPHLHQAEEQLKEQLDEICGGAEIADETTGEVIRLEETLSLATESAKEVVTLRRKIRDRDTRERRSGPTAPDLGEHQPDQES